MAHHGPATWLGDALWEIWGVTMHWLRRMLIAAALAYLFAILTLPVFEPVARITHELSLRLFGVGLFPVGTVVVLTLVWIIPTLIVAVLTFAALTRWARSGRDNECRCRKCGYILRGISEPRCPECGERI